MTDVRLFGGPLDGLEWFASAEPGDEVFAFDEVSQKAMCGEALTEAESEAIVDGVPTRVAIYSLEMRNGKLAYCFVRTEST